MTRVPLRTAVLLVLVFAATAKAQTTAPADTPIRPVSTGDKLRITMPDGRRVSGVAAGAITDSTLQLRQGSTLDLKTVSKVERVVPDPLRNGFLWGMLAGGAVGIVWGALDDSTCSPGSTLCIDVISRGEGAMLAGLVCAGFGGAAGLVIDATEHRREIVYPARPTRRPVTLTPTVSPRVRGLSVSFRW